MAVRGGPPFHGFMPIWFGCSWGATLSWLHASLVEVMLWLMRASSCADAVHVLGSAVGVEKFEFPASGYPGGGLEKSIDATSIESA